MDPTANPFPFSGLDPFLEQIWETVHHDIIVIAKEQLAVQISSRFKITTESTAYNNDGAEITINSIVISEQKGILPVARIELLSPWTKRGDGRKQYLSKRDNWIRSGIALIEIDLVRTGTDLPEAVSLPVSDRYAILHRPGRETGSLYQFPLRLPLAPLPLPIPDQTLLLDMQAVLNRGFIKNGWKSCLFDLYDKPLRGISAEDVAWAKDCVRKWKNDWDGRMAF